MARPDFVWTWKDFVDHFDQKFFPEHIREKRALEFETLVQGEMTVSQYEAQFVTLYHFASYLDDDEKRKAKCFVSGLPPALYSRVVGHLLTTFDEVVHRALVYEEDWALSERTREQSSSGDRKRKAPSGSSRQHRHQRHRGHSGFRQHAAQPTSSSSQSKAPSSGPFIGVCYGYEQFGHRRRECPHPLQQQRPPHLPSPHPPHQ
ncbi:uncharacterized protein LOC131247079 [Magnolia sinica]|uniref:uncharacterized protein LOC131247079 n=1 Tax=Magnolia sinica TaxID=86752 RepID=UPI00265B3B41|nr:uncharacterized protein LOC131247079 [Magnolia sinica]